MRRWRWAAPILAGIALALWMGRARGETFVFVDEERGEVRGKVLVEFQDLIFVALDGEGPVFVRRAELRGIVDEAGKRYESPPLGTFAAIGEAAPAAALTDVTGEAFVAGHRESAAGGEAPPPVEGAPEGAPSESPAPSPLARAGERVLREQEGGAEFVGAGEAVRTGHNGVVRGVFPSGASFWVGVESEVAFGGPTEQIGVSAGELTLESRLNPVQILSARGLDLRLAEASMVIAQREGSTIRLEQHRGRTRVAWPELSFALQAGQSVSLSLLGQGRWSVAADETNAEPLALIAKGEAESLAPGQTRDHGTEVVPETEVWRHLSSQGELFLRRGPQGTFRSSPSLERSLLSLGPGDGLRCEVGGSATFVRQDGARITLRSASWLELEGREVRLIRGELLVEALGAPVPVGTPGGTARLRECVTVLRRIGDGQSGPLEASAVVGSPRFPLGFSSLTLAGRSRVNIDRSPTPADPPAELERLRLEARGLPAAGEEVARGGQAPAEGPAPAPASAPGAAPVPTPKPGPEATGEGQTAQGAGEALGSPGAGEAPGSPGAGEAPGSPGGALGAGQAPTEPGGVLGFARRGARLLAASSGAQGLPSLRVELLAGSAQIDSGPVDGLGDPGYQVLLDGGDLVFVHPPSPLKLLGGLGLPGERELRFRAEALGVSVQVDEIPELRFPERAPVRLKAGLVVALTQRRDLPTLEFRSGERLVLEALPIAILVENPTVRIEPYEAVVEFTGGIEVALREAGSFGALAFATRSDDQLEARKGHGARLGLRSDNVELTLDDGRQLRIQPKAPPVDARFSDAGGTLYLSMPGAPSLGLAPGANLTVLATDEGEFVVLDKGRSSLETLSGPGSPVLMPGFDRDAERLLDLLDLPVPDSPSGP